jgi:AraC-like DNA-binding protein
MIPNSNFSETKIRSKELFSLAPAIEYCEKNYMNNFTVDCLAEKCHLSTPYFGKIFKKTLRLSPLEYIHHTRIYKACVLLSTGRDSILGVSIKTGFSSLSSFNRQFKAIRGISPSEWRKKAVSKRNDEVSHTIFSMDEIENHRKQSN